MLRIVACQRWIFILEGIVTVLVAAVSFWMLHDYPDTAKFLTPQEKQFMHDRLKLDSDGCSQEFKYKFAWDAFRDWKVWVSGTFHDDLEFPSSNVGSPFPTLQR